MAREVLVLYYSQHGSVKELAQWIAKGIEQVSGVVARIRTVPKVSSVSEAVAQTVPESGPPYVEHADDIRKLGQHYKMTLDPVRCFPYRR